MKISEAYEELGLPQTAILDDVKKQYKLLAKKWHPDVNKEPDAEAKFKKINEAYQVVSSGQSTDRQDTQWQRPTYGQHPFEHRRVIQIENIDLYTTISFKESVLGCKKEMKFKRKGKCPDCEGQGQTKINNGCEKCKGSGYITTRQSNMIFTQTCNKCFGQSKMNNCKLCSESGFVETDVSINVSIPGGIQDNNILRLNNMGNYVGTLFSSDQYSEAFLHINVTPEPGLSINGSHVISNLDITLLEALRGCQKTVKTILGDKEISINPLSKNKDEIALSHLGVNGIGDQKVILNVEYPKDINKLIDILI